MTDNPFTLLTFIAAPAVLTNASSVLALNTANRYGRAFDRTKEIGRDLERYPQQDDLRGFRVRLLEQLKVRALYLLRAQIAFHLAIALWVGSALVVLLGAAVSVNRPEILTPFAICGFGVGALATICIVCGCVYAMRETRIAMVNLRDEEELLVVRHARPPERGAGVAAQPPRPH